VAAFLVPRPTRGARGRVARALYAVAAFLAGPGATPCPTCERMAMRIGAGGRAAERRAWRAAWDAGRRRS
jgi:hypothetical protein